MKKKKEVIDLNTNSYNMVHLTSRVKICGRWMSILNTQEMLAQMGISCSIDILDMGIKISAKEAKNNTTSNILIPYEHVAYLERI